MSHATSPWPAGEVRVSYARISELSDAGREARAMAWLEPAERGRYDRFRGADDRAMFVLGRVMARALVGRAAGVAPVAWRWREGARGRPEIAWPPTTLQFNLAHSAGLAVCALADGREVGVDVEDLQRRPVERELVRRYCSRSEAADIERAGEAWHDRFLLYWTLKEAYLKARGLGITVQLADIDFSNDGTAPSIRFIGSLAGADTRWGFRLAQPTERHLMAVAAAAHDVQPRFVITPFDWSATEA